MRPYGSVRYRRTATITAVALLTSIGTRGQNPNVTVAPADLEPTVAWATVADYKVRERTDWRTPALLQYGVALHKADPSLSADEIQNRMQALDDLASGKYSDGAADVIQSTLSLVPVTGDTASDALPLAAQMAQLY